MQTYDYLRHQVRKLKFHYNDSELNLSDHSLKLFWFNETVNFGDYFNYHLASNISKKEVEWVPYNYSNEYFMAIGSVLQLATNKTIVWGSGLISDRYLPIKPPKEILSVRGPLTRKVLVDAGISCPEIYGDPALISPLYYSPNCSKKFDLGIIPHYIDKKNKFFLQNFSDVIKVIDINNPDYKQIVNDILSCKKIISSSLHGLIIADAYDVPALRVKFSNKIVGGDFKFNDYFLSVKREIQSPFLIKDVNQIKEILNLSFRYKKNINMNKILSASPFK